MSTDARPAPPPVDAQDHTRGSAESPVTVLVYGDFECPYTRHVELVLERLRGRLGPDAFREVYRHFPMRAIHPHAQSAAEAAEAAAAQDRYWEMHTRLFSQQDQLDDASLIAHAETLELDVDRFAADLRDHRHADRVERDLQGAARTVRGTPTLFLNGVRYRGERSIPTLEAAIAEAAAAGPP
jgi:NhaA family Na+:H+ antiporter